MEKDWRRFGETVEQGHRRGRKPNNAGQRTGKGRELEVDNTTERGIKTLAWRETDSGRDDMKDRMVTLFIFENITPNSEKIPRASDTWHTQTEDHEDRVHGTPKRAKTKKRDTEMPSHGGA